MILLEINPLTPSVAISEMVIVLLVAALVGYLIGRWITNGQLKQLRQVLEIKEGELNDCQAQQLAPIPAARAVTADTAIQSDDLKLIEGIGPKIEKLLNASNIFNFSQLAVTSPEVLSSLLREAGPRFQVHNPESWPEQAALARDGKWEDLEDLQEKLTGGRDLS